MREGIVVNIEKRYVVILTRNGEFVRVKYNKSTKPPVKGEEYTGKEIKHRIKLININKKYILIAMMITVAISVVCTYLYTRTKGSVSFNDGVSVVLGYNHFDRIVKVEAYDELSNDFLDTLSLSNKDIEKGMIKVFDKLKTYKYDGERVLEKGDTIVVRLDKSTDIELESFIEEIKNQERIKVKITGGGKVIYGE